MKKMITIGLTGSIAMGKSTLSSQAKELGVEVIDADSLAKEFLFSISEIKDYFPEAVINGQINISLMRQIVFADHEKLKKLERLIYPSLTEHINKLLSHYKLKGYEIVMIDAPKLFEAGLDSLCDYIVTVDAPKEIQLERIRARGKYSEEQITQILASQMPNEEKVARSNFKIDTSLGIKHSLEQLKMILTTIL